MAAGLSRQGLWLWARDTGILAEVLSGEVGFRGGLPAVALCWGEAGACTQLKLVSHGFRNLQALDIICGPRLAMVLYSALRCRSWQAQEHRAVLLAMALCHSPWMAAAAMAQAEVCCASADD